MGLGQRHPLPRALGSRAPNPCPPRCPPAGLPACCAAEHPHPCPRPCPCCGWVLVRKGRWQPHLCSVVPCAPPWPPSHQCPGWRGGPFLSRFPPARPGQLCSRGLCLHFPDRETVTLLGRNFPAVSSLQLNPSPAAQRTPQQLVRSPSWAAVSSSLPALLLLLLLPAAARATRWWDVSGVGRVGLGRVGLGCVVGWDRAARGSARCRRAPGSPGVGGKGAMGRQPRLLWAVPVLQPSAVVVSSACLATRDDEPLGHLR